MIPHLAKAAAEERLVEVLRYRMPKKRPTPMANALYPCEVEEEVQAERIHGAATLRGSLSAVCRQRALVDEIRDDELVEEARDAMDVASTRAQVLRVTFEACPSRS
jgi:hypothetical protein